MKWFFLILLFLVGCSTKPFEKYPGAYVWGQCAPYAQAVVADLEQHHIEAYKVVYIWRSGGQSGAHAVVLYRATDGRWAIVENSWCTPGYVKGKTLLAMVKSYDPNAVMVTSWDQCPLPLEGRAITAAWYGEECRGKIMANGKPFDPNMRTCASWFFPLGQRLKVSHADRTVFVTVCDRGPARRLLGSRQLDLSRAAFEALGNLKLGLIGVTVEQIP